MTSAWCAVEIWCRVVDVINKEAVWKSPSSSEPARCPGASVNSCSCCQLPPPSAAHVTRWQWCTNKGSKEENSQQVNMDVSVAGFRCFMWNGNAFNTFFRPQRFTQWVYWETLNVNKNFVYKKSLRVDFFIIVFFYSYELLFILQCNKKLNYLYV